MDKGTSEEVADKWPERYEEIEEELVKAIGTIESAIIGEEHGEEQHLRLGFVRDAYNHIRELYKMLDFFRTKSIKQAQSIQALRKRIELLEVESTEQAKQRRIRDM